MKPGPVVTGVVIAALGIAGGYWWGSASGPGVQVAAEATKSANTTEVATGASKRILYYRNPMGLADTSPTPKKDAMGMDYVPVYEGDEPSAGGAEIRVSPDRVQKLGVRVEPAARRDLVRVVRAAGRVEPDERRAYAITAKFEGYIERLHVNATGQPVARGQPLFEVYSPELVAAQREYAIAASGEHALKDASEESRAAMRQLAQSSLARLRNWDVPEDHVQALARGSDVRRTVTFRSPVGGIVTERKALQGMRFMPGEALYQVTDLSGVWIIADVFEQDLGLVRQGSLARIAINAYPERAFSGRITFVYPKLSAETRTIPVRIELPNPDGALKPGMYASVELAGAGRRNVVTVPVGAVIDSGVRQIVLVRTGEGRFAPRDVKVGMRSDAYVELTEGIQEGEVVVTAANFLIDAESNLRAAIGGLTAGSTTSAPAGNEAAGRVGHRASGRVDSVDAGAATATIAHGPVPSLKWPAMTMRFALTNPAQLQGLAPGAAVDFEFVERKPGEYVITKVAPVRSATAAVLPPAAPASPASPHKY